MTKWEHINNKRFHSHLSYSHSRSILICLSNLVPIPMGIQREGWESRIYYSHAHSLICTHNKWIEFLKNNHFGGDWRIDLKKKSRRVCTRDNLPRPMHPDYFSTIRVLEKQSFCLTIFDLWESSIFTQDITYIYIYIHI